MRNWILRLVIVVFIGAGAIAQSKDKPIDGAIGMANADFGQYPVAYEELIKEWAASNLKDPESARFGAITKPRKEWVVANLAPVYGFSVCADINAKNSYGGYTGSQTFWFFIRDNKIVRAQNTFAGFPGKMISRGHNVSCEDGAEGG